MGRLVQERTRIYPFFRSVYKRIEESSSNETTSKELRESNERSQKAIRKREEFESAKYYETIVTNAFRLFKMTDLATIEKMTLKEYNLRMQAYRLQQVDRMFERRDLAWAIVTAKSVDKEGNYIYREFKDFFDYDEAIKAVENVQVREEDMDQDLVRIARRLAEYRKGGGKI